MLKSIVALLVFAIVTPAIAGGGYCNSGCCNRTSYVQHEYVATPTNLTNIGTYNAFQQPAPYLQQYPLSDAGYTASVAEQISYGLQGMTDQVSALRQQSQARAGYGQGSGCNVNVYCNQPGCGPQPTPNPSPWPAPPGPQPNQPPTDQPPVNPQPNPQPDPQPDPPPAVEPGGPVPPNTSGGTWQGMRWLSPPRAPQPQRAPGPQQHQAAAFDTCLHCHGAGGKYQGKFNLAVPLSCAQLIAAREAVKDERMPKRSKDDKSPPLSDEAKASVYAELLARLGNK